jgi:hypothetical protein
MGLLPTKPLLFAIVATLSATSGCGHPLSRKLEGRWFGSGVESFEQRELPAATGWARGVSFEFSGDRLTVAIPAEEPRTAPYKIASVHGPDVKLSVQRPDGTLDPLALRVDDESSMRWMLDRTHAVVLKRE